MANQTVGNLDQFFGRKIRGDLNRDRNIFVVDRLEFILLIFNGTQKIVQRFTIL